MSLIGILRQKIAAFTADLETDFEAFEADATTVGKDVLSELGTAISQLPVLAIDAIKAAVSAALPTAISGNLAAAATSAGAAALATVTSQGVQLADQDVLALQSKIANDLIAAVGAQPGTATVGTAAPAEAPAAEAPQAAS